MDNSLPYETVIWSEDEMRQGQLRIGSLVRNGVPCQKEVPEKNPPNPRVILLGHLKSNAPRKKKTKRQFCQLNSLIHFLSPSPNS